MFTITFKGGETTEANAYDAAVQVKYLGRDGVEDIKVFDEDGVDVPLQRLIKFALAERTLVVK